MRRCHVLDFYTLQLYCIGLTLKTRLKGLYIFLVIFQGGVLVVHATGSWMLAPLYKYIYKGGEVIIYILTTYKRACKRVKDA